MIDAKASVRMALGEAITNLSAASIHHLEDVKLSANWMASAGHAGEDAALFDAVEEIGMHLCPDLGISIPVGKDSMSMKTTWLDQSQEKRWYHQCLLLSVPLLQSLMLENINAGTQ